ncbi:E3 ubiquitin-protein ligase msl-2 [Acyrthosiphon pisum]|uniref:CXC MSL2-type domain-containing protein n=1 Tax=Acyrthosiphon pisum TaxID=7029 RepID=A0A8R1W7Q7_ACYPI|nr:E3 ubiquitin-protein ligase msl-2 [Acyrthosiphon pisum]|eukprot:XP_003243452.1 PREDICTED: E3 ubiquitin-protein ligase msl-2 [Acyrthosiphon pisum]
MALIEYYLSTSQIVLQAKSTDPLTWQKLHSLLPLLHEHLSCQVCHKLVDRLNPYLDGYACTVCVNHQITENPSSAIIQCYKKLCAYIHSSPLYKVMCTRVEDKRLVELVTEVISLPRSINGYSGMVNGTVIKQEKKEKDIEDDSTLMVNGTMNKQEIKEEDIEDDSTLMVNGTMNKQEIKEEDIEDDFTLMVNGIMNKQEIKEENSKDDITLISSSDIQLPTVNETPEDYINYQIFDVQSQKHKIQNQSVFNNIPKKKKNERRWGCRCGNATTTPGKLTCFGQRCPCYTEQKPCDQCKCRGCRNPRQKRSNNDDNLEIDQIRRKPVTLELVSSLKPSSHNNSNSLFSAYTMHDMLQFSSHSQQFDQGGTEDNLGHVNSIFHSP